MPHPKPATPMQEITAEDRVSDVLDQYPELLATIVEHGFRPLANLVLRKTLARRVTVGQACRHLDVDLPQFLSTLNARKPRPSRTLALTLVH